MNVGLLRLNAALSNRYIIERELGAGGMATVYLAQDVRHDRKVALKVLKPELAAVVGSERFLTEIRTTANLQHPHILPLFDSGEADGFLFYVMPYVEGESLRDCLNREKQLPVEEATRIASEVADALDHAHRRDVIHRDIKPENVLLQDGRVLVADFGIALAVNAGGGARLTETGLSLGTPSYMSPEQATGDRVVDGRADIYAVGCLLYEMLTGQPPHTGSTAQAILASVLTNRPRPVTQFRETVPQWLEALTERALARLPADRFRDAAALREALAGRGEAGSPGLTERPSPKRAGSGWLGRVAWIALGLAAGLSLAIGLNGEKENVPLPPTHITAALPENVHLRLNWMGTLTPSVTISPDGREVVFVGEREGRQLYRMRLDAPGGIEPIPGTEGGRAPFYSPSGQWIGFVAGNSLFKIPSGGGRPVPLARVIVSRGGSWDPTEEFIYLTPRVFSSVHRVPANGGELEKVTELARDGIDMTHTWPTILPNGDLLYTSCCADVGIYLLEGADPEATPIRLLDGGFARYVPSGHLLFMHEGATLVAPYDLETREAGPPREVLPEAITAHEMFGEFAVSATGSLVYLAGRSEFERPLVRVYPDGSADPMAVPPASHVFPLTFSPDGRRMVFVSYGGGGGTNVFLYDLQRGGRPVPLTTDQTEDYSATWGPGPAHITFTSLRDGRQDVYTLAVDSFGAEPRLLISNELGKWPHSWTEDGRWLLFGVDAPERGESIWVYSAEADSAWALIDEPYDEFNAYFTPAGDWIAYDREDSGRREVWAMPFPDGVPCPISINGGNEPRWSPHGRRLYYVKADTLMVAEAGQGSICDARPRPFVSGVNSVWGLAPDESYAVTVAPEPEPELRLILNWADELREQEGGGG